MTGRCGNCGKEGATAKCSRCKSVTYCGKDCQTSAWSSHKKECKRIAQERAAAASEPTLRDEWGLTTVDADLVQRLKKDCAGLSEAAADRVIYLACNNGQANMEGMVFPFLFPFGSGYYGSRKDSDTLFASYVNHLLKLSTGNFLKNTAWLAYVVGITAMIRAVRGGGRPATGDALSENDKTTLEKVSKAYPQHAFCLRYLAGDEEGLWLLMMYLRDMQQRAG